MRLLREMFNGLIDARTLMASAVVMAIWLGAYNGATAAGQAVNPESTIAVYCNPQSSKPNLALELDLAGGGLIAKCARGGGGRGGGGGGRGGGFSPGFSYANTMNQLTTAWQGAVAAQNAHFNQVEREAERLLNEDSSTKKTSKFEGGLSGSRSTKTTQSGTTHSGSKITAVKPEPATPMKPTVPSLLDASSGMSRIASVPSGQQLGQTRTNQATASNQGSHPATGRTQITPAPTAGAGHETSGSHLKHDDRNASQLLQSSPGMKQIASTPNTLYQKENPKDQDIIDEFADEIGGAVREAEIEAGLTPINPSSGGPGTNQGTTAPGKQTASTGPGKQTVSTGAGKDKATEQAIKNYQDKYRKLSDEYWKTMNELKELGSPYLGINPGKRAELEEKLRNLQSQMNALPYPGEANGPAPISGVPGSGQGPTGPGSSQVTPSPGKDNKTTSPGKQTASSGSGTGKDKPGSSSAGRSPGQQGTYYDPATDTIGIYQADKDGNFTKVRDLEVGEEFVDSDGDSRIYDGAGGGRLVEDWNKQKVTNEKYDSDRLSDPRDQGTAPSEFFNDFNEKTKEAEDLLNTLTQLEKFVRDAPPGVSPSLHDFVSNQIPDYNTAKTDPKKVKDVIEAVKNVVQGEREKEVGYQEEKDAFWSEAIHDAELAKLAGEIALSYLGGKAIEAAAEYAAQYAAAERLAAAAKAERDAARAGKSLNETRKTLAAAENAVHKAAAAKDALKPLSPKAQALVDKWKAAKDLEERRDLARRALEVKEIGRLPESHDLFNPKNSQHLDYLLHR